ncbi:cyclophilin-like fold protein [Priestia endophytica]|uniref:cyclophilin-like fold protein n=1 Tax=Priestia endophytica TaxID=135735 RepID=UPI000DCA5059|nr:cyclophilin-like fold protein [Priestia endophytica]RAS83629.1 hypothetical protein A4U60_10500 [Priestia endophytica]
MEGTRITIGDWKLVSVMEDNPTARLFLSKLPTTVNFCDFAGGEKVGDALRALSCVNISILEMLNEHTSI